MVAVERIELSRVSPNDFESFMSTVPSHRQGLARSKEHTHSTQPNRERIIALPAIFFKKAVYFAFYATLSYEDAGQEGLLGCHR